MTHYQHNQGEHSLMALVLWKLEVLQHFVQRQGNKLMSKITEFIAAQEAFNMRQATAVDAISTSVTGLTQDISSLNDLIVALQNSPDRITEADQAALDAIVAASSAVTDKSEAVSAALATLDALTPPPVPVP